MVVPSDHLGDGDDGFTFPPPRETPENARRDVDDTPSPSRPFHPPLDAHHHHRFNGNVSPILGGHGARVAASARDVTVITLGVAVIASACACWLLQVLAYLLRPLVTATGAALLLRPLVDFVSDAQYQRDVVRRHARGGVGCCRGNRAVTVPRVVAIVFALGATKTMDAFNRLTPSAVVQGMQVGLGMLLARKGFVLAVYASSDASRARKMTGVDGLLVTMVAFCGVMYACAPEYPPASTAAGADAGELGATTEAKERKKRVRHYVPTALILVVVGIVMAMTKKGALSGLRFGPSTPKVLNASRAEVRRGIVRAAVPQLPLTTLNSVISVCALSKELFPDLPASPSSVATSVGVMNVVGCWLGAMPSCHGAGGLAAQYAFGARGGGSIAFLGACKLILGFVFGSSLTHLLDRFPKNILGVMLFSSSLELMGMGLKTKPGWQQHQKYLVMVTAAVTVATKSTAIGFAAGAGTHVLMEVQRRVETGSSMT